MFVSDHLEQAVHETLDKLGIELNRETMRLVSMSLLSLAVGHAKESDADLALFRTILDEMIKNYGNTTPTPEELQAFTDLLQRFSGAPALTEEQMVRMTKGGES